MPIVIVPANPDWPQAFARIKAALFPALPAGAVVHHIGSTAVPGLPAKDIIDVQVTVATLAEIEDATLAAAGFSRRRPLSDHTPPGMTLPPKDLEKRLFGTDHPHPANIHFRVRGAFNQRYPILCRDYLRAHPLAAAAYATIKHHLAARFPNDAEAYYDIKDPVFDLIMVGAEAWAKRTRWTAPPGD
jgi:GrpB-like predicted nucleotidyltransferase (UPF0157 family)